PLPSPLPLAMESASVPQKDMEAGLVLELASLQHKDLEAEVVSKPVKLLNSQESAAPSKPPVVQRFALQATIGESAYENLRYAQALLGHQVPSGDLGQVLELALKALVQSLEKTKFAASSRPRHSLSHRF